MIPQSATIDVVPSRKATVSVTSERKADVAVAATPIARANEDWFDLLCDDTGDAICASDNQEILIVR